MIEYVGLATDDLKQPPPVSMQPYIAQAASAESLSSVSVTPTFDVVMSDGSGGQLGFANGADIAVSTSGIGIRPDDTDYPFAHPTDYLIGPGPQSVTMSNFQDPEVRWSWRSDSLVCVYQRGSAAVSDSDIVAVGDAMSAVNRDAITKTTHLTTIQVEGTVERYARLGQVAMAQNDSLTVTMDTTGAIEISNSGSAKSYDLILWYSASFDDGYIQPLQPVSIEANANHRVEPVWPALEVAPITILIDNDQNGTYEDTTTADVPTAAEEPEGPVLPGTFSLSQNYPNPFNPSTRISYTVPKQSDVTIRVFNILGQQVRKFAEGVKAPGIYEIQFNATASGSALPSGVYFYRMEAGDFTQTKRMLLLK